MFSSGNNQSESSWKEIKDTCDKYPDYRRKFSSFLGQYAEQLDFQAFSKLMKAKDRLNDYFHRIQLDLQLARDFKSGRS